MSTSRRRKSSLVMAGVIGLHHSDAGKNDAWHSASVVSDSSSSQRRGRRVLSSLSYPSSMLYPWRGGETEPLDNKVDDLLQEETENRQQNLDTLFLDEFREDLQKVRSDIEADTMGSLYRLRRDILVQRVRRAQKQAQRQQRQGARERMSTPKSTPSINSDEQQNDTQLKSEVSGEQSVPEELPVINDAEKQRIGEEAAQLAVGEAQPKEAATAATEVPLEETEEEKAVEIDQLGDDMKGVGDLMDESLDWLATDAEEGETQRERLDVFDDFVVGETDEAEEDVLNRLMIPGDYEEALKESVQERDSGVKDKAIPETKPSKRGTTKRRRKKSKAKQDESKVKDSDATVQSSAKRKKSKTKKKKKHAIQPVGGSNENDVSAERIVTISSGVKSKVMQKAELKRRKQKQRENIVRPLDDDDDEMEDDVDMLESTSNVVEEKQKDSDTLMFVKTVGLFAVMMLLCYLISLVYDYLIGKVVSASIS